MLRLTSPRGGIATIYKIHMDKQHNKYESHTFRGKTLSHMLLGQNVFHLKDGRMQQCDTGRFLETIQTGNLIYNSFVFLTRTTRLNTLHAHITSSPQHTSIRALYPRSVFGVHIKQKCTELRGKNGFWSPLSHSSDAPQRPNEVPFCRC